MSPVGMENSSSDMEPGSSDTQSSPCFPIMKLPAEIRRHILYLALPAQDAPRHSTEWAVIDLPNQSMGVLRASKLLYTEAREILYGLNCFDIAISFFGMTILGLPTRKTHYVKFPTSPLFNCVRHWQLDLQFEMPHEDPYQIDLAWDNYAKTRDWQAMRETIISASEELAKNPSLQSLKVKFPCNCNSDMTCERLSELLAVAFDPLKRLHFQASVTFIAAPYLFGEWLRGNYEPRACNIQCQQPQCLALAASFEELSGFLRDRTAARPRLAFRDQTWLDLKKRATPFLGDWSLDCSLDQAWMMVDWMRDEDDSCYPAKFGIHYTEVLGRIKELEEESGKPESSIPS